MNHSIFSRRERERVRAPDQQAIYFALTTRRRTTPKTLNLDLASFEHKKLLLCFEQFITCDFGAKYCASGKVHWFPCW